MVKKAGHYRGVTGRMLLEQSLPQPGQHRRLLSSTCFGHLAIMPTTLHDVARGAPLGGGRATPHVRLLSPLGLRLEE